MEKTSKRILPWLISFITAILLMSGVFAVEASAEVSGDYEYTVTDGKAKITGYTGTSTEITIPSKLGGYPVTSIGDNELYSKGVFAGCKDLTRVTIPDSVTSIGVYAFSGCSGLTSVTIPDSVTKIYKFAFYGCTGLTSITIPDSVTNIDIYNFAFSDCTGLTSVTIPDSVAFIGDSAFSGCTGITEFVVSASNMDYCSKDDVLFSKNMKTLFYYPAAKKATAYTIPDTVISIGNYAFYGCTSLTSITIPDSVTSIGIEAFYFCDGLTSITIPDSVTSIGNLAFSKCSNISEFIVSSSNTNYCSEGGVLFNKSMKTLLYYPSAKEASSYTIPNSVTSIGNLAFYGCDGLTSITIPDSVTSIGDGTFSACDGLTSITIPNSVTSIGEEAFSSCTGLTHISIPNSVTSIGIEAFYACENLISITIPDSVTSIGDRAFYCCYGLTHISIPNSITSIGDSTFWQCTGLRRITIPDSIAYIDNYAFYKCLNLENVFYTGSSSDWENIEIGNYNECLTNVTIHYSYDKVHFEYTVTNGNATITKFMGTAKELSIPSELDGYPVTDIGDNAFEDCDLISVTIPGSVFSIANMLLVTALNCQV